MHDCAVFYINLDGSDARRLHIESQLKLAGFDLYTRVPAFDGRDLELTSCKDYLEAEAVRFMGRPMNGGEYGCYRSHLDCLSRFQLRDETYCLVIEDDVSIDDGFEESLELIINAIEAANLDWDVIHLSADRMKMFTPFAAVSDARDLVAAHYFPMTTSALLWSRSGAKRFLEAHSKIVMPIDNQLREAMVRSGKGFAVWPALANQSALESDIDGKTVKRKEAGRRWFYGLAKQRRLLINKLIAFVRSILFRVFLLRGENLRR